MGISESVIAQQIKLSKLDLPKVSGIAKFPKKDVDELENIKEETEEHQDTQDKIDFAIGLLKDNSKSQSKQHEQQVGLHKKTHDQLSPKQTIGLAFAVGLMASIIGAMIFGFVINPAIINSTNSTIP